MFGMTTPLICMAAAMYFEARGEPILGELAVGQVIMTRVNSPRWPNDVCSVVKQGGTRHDKCNFSFYCDGRSDRPRDQEAWQRAKALAETLLTKPYLYDPSHGADHYHNDSVNPYWASGFKFTVKIGHHLFFKDLGNVGRQERPTRITTNTITHRPNTSNIFAADDGAR